LSNVCGVPKFIHQQTVDFFHNQPTAAVALLREVGGIELPRFAMATAEAVDATQLASVEYRADAVVVLRDGSGTARLAVIVEVQLRRDAKKRFSWPVYAAALRARLECDEELLMTASADYEKVIGARYFSEWVNKGLEQGRAEGEIEAILTVLDARGLDIPAEARERISRCSDLHLLEKWIRRAVTVTSVDELFV
jgi:hypothetical protein